MRHTTFILTGLLLFLLLPTLAVATEPSGMIKVLQGTVTIERAGIPTAAALGGAVFVNDQIVTGTDGTIGVTFQDNSLLSLGPNSRLVVDQFQFDSTSHNGNFISSLKQGKLAVVSGKIAKHQQDAMKIRTPSSILGVRGTEFLVEITP